MRKLQVLWAAVCALTVSSSAVVGQETSLSVTIVNPALPIGDAVDGVRTATIPDDATGTVIAEARVVLTSNVGPGSLDPATCAADPTADCPSDDPAVCGEHILTFDDFGDPIFGCSNSDEFTMVDDDADGTPDPDDCDCRGVQGWSISIETGPCFGIGRATTDGTAGALNSNGGERDLDGGNFEKTEVINPANPANAGREGAVSAVVLSFTNPFILDKVSENDVLVLQGMLDQDAAVADGCLLRIQTPEEDGLTGSGEPVKTAVTVGGETDAPAVVALRIATGEPTGPETICDDEIDNDEDGDTDCDDSDCEMDPVCVCTPTPGQEDAETSCDDGEDNDCDMLVDLDDPDCVCTPTPGQEDAETSCDDGEDNDCDGDIDAADSDCAPPPSGEASYVVTFDGATDEGGAWTLGVEDPPGAQMQVSSYIVLESNVGAGPLDPATCAPDPSADCPSDDPAVCGEHTLTFDDFGDPIFGCSNSDEFVMVDDDEDGTPDPDDCDCYGVQGWSMSVETAPCFGIGRATTDGTAGALNSNGGERDLDGGNFEKTEVVNPAVPENGGREGAVSAVVLSFTNPFILDKVSSQPILLLNGRIDTSGLVNQGDMTDPCEVLIIPAGEPGLKGSGEPVQTAVTVGGTTAVPGITNGTLKIALGGMPPPTEDGPLVRGDPNDDGRNNIADAVWIINELFQDGPAAGCQEASDVNDDDMVDSSDALYVIMYQFEAGSPPPAPFPACGMTSGEDMIGCDTPPTSCP